MRCNSSLGKPPSSPSRPSPCPPSATSHNHPLALALRPPLPLTSRLARKGSTSCHRKISLAQSVPIQRRSNGTKIRLPLIHWWPALLTLVLFLLLAQAIKSDNPFFLWTPPFIRSLLDHAPNTRCPWLACCTSSPTQATCILWFFLPMFGGHRRFVLPRAKDSPALSLAGLLHWSAVPAVASRTRPSSSSSSTASAPTRQTAWALRRLQLPQRPLGPSPPRHGRLRPPAIGSPSPQRLAFALAGSRSPGS